MKNHDTPNKSPDPTRRTFIRRGLGAVAVSSLGFPMVLPSRVFGANERVVLGMIGVGNMGSTHVRGFSGSCGIAGIADAYLPRAEAAAKGLRGPNQTDFYQDYRAPLERDDIDAVVIATPAHQHALNCVHAAMAGKDIYQSIRENPRPRGLYVSGNLSLVGQVEPHGSPILDDDFIHATPDSPGG